MWKNLLENLPEGVLVYKDTMLSFMNKQMAKLLKIVGYEKMSEYEINFAISKIITPDSKSNLFEELQRFLSTQKNLNSTEASIDINDIKKLDSNSCECTSPILMLSF